MGSSGPESTLRGPRVLHSAPCPGQDVELSLLTPRERYICFLTPVDVRESTGDESLVTRAHAVQSHLPYRHPHFIKALIGSKQSSDEPGWYPA